MSGLPVLEDVQGDVLGGFPKKSEVFYFFQITNAALFKSQLNSLIPLIKSTAQVREDREAIERARKDHRGPGKAPLVPFVGVNISFSIFGLRKLDIPDVETIGDAPFIGGQLLDARNALADNVDKNWTDAFKDHIIDAVVNVAGDTSERVEEKLQEVQAVLGLGTNEASIDTVTTIFGNVRPGDDSAHEHFGFMDGISNPLVEGFDDTPPVGAPDMVKPGSIIVGRDGDSVQTRPPWAVDGSFLVFRHLFQLVPEFHAFLDDNRIMKPGMTPQEGSDLLGARIVGRWKSGAPVDLTPDQDNLDIANDPNRVNSFNYLLPGEQQNQIRCPFAAHTRKTFPRSDLTPNGLTNRRILRRGIQFGPEVTPEEAQAKKTNLERGLLFACYQGNIQRAFRFIQQSWANNPDFIVREKTGQDLLIGQVGGGDRTMISGNDPTDPNEKLTAPEFVISRGGEYFFVPSIKALKEVFAA